jgi:HEPN domain-containing protein
MASIGENDYRAGANQRLREAFILLRAGHYSGSVYLAGRAVEGMLRAVIWKSDPEYATGRKNLATGHDLKDMLALIRSLGALRDHPLRESLKSDVQKIGRLWWNNMRFLPKLCEALWQT